MRREPCQVSGCRNSSARAAEHGHQYLCSRCWAGVPRWMKRRSTALVRKLVKAGLMPAPAPSDEVYYGCKPRARYLLHKSWRLMVRAATERAAGI